MENRTLRKGHNTLLKFCLWLDTISGHIGSALINKRKCNVVKNRVNV